jgi:hypothetical protein
VRPLVLVLLAVLAATGSVRGEAPPPSGTPSRTPSGTPAPVDAAVAERLQRQIDRALEAGRWQESLEQITRYLRDVERDPIMLYNAACCHAHLGDQDAGAAALLDAVKAGFRDFDTMEADPDLAPLREHPTFLAILEAADAIKSGRRAGPALPADPQPDRPAPRRPAIDVAACPAADEWKARHGDRNYRYESDDVRRIHYATSLDEDAQREMRSLLERQADLQAKLLFGDEPDYPTLVAVPTVKDARRYFADPTTTGIYEHRTKRLVVRDIGQSLQHEFTHLMHYGDMERRRQKHPIWIQEGLASLFEDYEVDPDDRIRFLPNTRHNVARRQVLNGGAMAWKDLFALSPQEFMDRSPAVYAQVRSIFEFVADRDRLVPWYRAYVEGFADDPSGAAAIAKAFGRDLDSIERSWRDWVRERSPIDDTINEGDASLGIGVADVPDGVRIRDSVAKSAARASGLRVGDVIVAIDGKPIRSARELQLAVAARKVGETVTVRFRREDDYLETAVTLRPLRLARRPAIP